MKAATRLIDADKMAANISIHAAREGGDTQSFFAKLDLAYFNPRRP